jgi:hypothetical protein
LKNCNESVPSNPSAEGLAYFAYELLSKYLPAIDAVNQEKKNLENVYMLLHHIADHMHRVFPKIIESFYRKVKEVVLGDCPRPIREQYLELLLTFKSKVY